jgi:2-C-methyl-D-erythritol 4-phosphate cytidylyltransferase
MVENSTLVLLCGGSGSRFGADKLFWQFCGRPYVYHVLAKLLKCWHGRIVVVVRESRGRDFVEVMETVGCENYALVVGGESRSESLKKGLEWVDTPWVFVHDGARLLFCCEVFRKLWGEKEGYSAVIPVEPVFHALRCGDTVVRREECFLTYTPQLFLSEHLFSVVGEECYDEAELLEKRGFPVKRVLDNCGFFKLTYKYQVSLLEGLLCE